MGSIGRSSPRPGTDNIAAGLTDPKKIANYPELVQGLKRFIKFLRDTERMKYEVADRALDVLKGKGGS